MTQCHMCSICVVRCEWWLCSGYNVFTKQYHVTVTHLSIDFLSYATGIGIIYYGVLCSIVTTCMSRIKYHVTSFPV